MDRLKAILMAVLLVWLTAFGVYALLDEDQEVSEVENRALTQKPAFTLDALLDGSYTTELAEYYADQFPLRETFMTASRWLNSFYYYADEENTLLISFDGADALQAGTEVAETSDSAETDETETAGTDDVQQDSGEQTIEAVQQPADTDTETDEAESVDTAAAAEQTAEELEVVEEEEESRTYPEEEDAFVPTDSSIMIVGDRAMDLPFASYDIIEMYAEAVNLIADTLGESVRTISLVTPNAGEFYTPVSFHTGNYSQKDMIDYCYSLITDAVTVDAYSVLDAHVDEYIYFRTDHHWTALGAYYAYTALCEAAGFTAVDLDEFESGRYEDFVGTMYTYTSGYAQSQVLLDNPDYVEYYLPVVETEAEYYTDSTMTDGVSISVVSTTVTSSNKYLCFISGDTPICKITTSADGPVCVVLKDSYGNALVPFLTSHYSTIYVIDPRSFNQEDMPELDLTEFVSDYEVDDVIIINYPFMINNKFYTRLLNRLVTDPDTWYEDSAS